MKHSTQFSLILGLLLLAGCGVAGSSPTAGAGSQPIQTMAQGSYCGVSRPGHQIVRDQDAWTKLWIQINNRRMPTPPVPRVDFSQDMVLAAFMGQRSSGGHGVQITEVKAKGDAWQIKVVETSPGDGCYNTQSLTQPFHVVQVPALKGNIKFKVVKQIRDCK